MSLRDRLLALLRDPAYSPGNEFELSRRLDLKKRDRAALTHEVRLLLKSGAFVRSGNGRIAPRGETRDQGKAETRKIFVPTRRGPTTPAPEEKTPRAGKAAPPPSSSRAGHREPKKKKGSPAAREPQRIEPVSIAKASPVSAPSM